MRINESTLVAATPETIWYYLADPENYLRFMSGITHWEVVGEKPSGLVPATGSCSASGPPRSVA